MHVSNVSSFRVGLLILLGNLIHPVLLAQPPALLHYQGRLIDGTNLYNGTARLLFNLYGSESSPFIQFASTAMVTVVDGLYATEINRHPMLGDLDTALALPAVWLEVFVNDVPMTPRERFMSVPYARMTHGFSLRPFNSILIGAPATGNDITNSVGATIGGGQQNLISGTHSGATIGGGIQNRINSTSVGFDNHATIAGGNANRIEFSDKAAISGGGNNNINFSGRSYIGGGFSNTINQSRAAVIGGGDTNTIHPLADFAVIGGGNQNSISNQAPNAVIAGGWQNFIGSGSTNSVIGGGADNRIPANSRHAVIAGGYSNRVGGGIFAPTVSGGRANEALATYSTVGGGIQNVIAGNSSFQGTIGGGNQNRIESVAPNSTIAGGQGNLVRGGSAFVGGGEYNLINTSGFHSVIGGGLSNVVQFNAQWSTISGGFGNSIWTNSSYVSVGGGLANRASGAGAVIAGGAFNVAAGQFATIPGGEAVFATNNAFAAGRRAKANHPGAFVWGDLTASDVVSTNDNSVTMRAGGGYRLFSNPLMSIGAQLVPFASSWAAISDRNAKENFAAIDTADILDKVAALPLTAWTYKDDPTHRRYIGPVAQDFHAAFGLGDDTTINTLDADGVALAAIQALAGQMSEDRGRMAELEAENAQLREELEAIKRKLGM